jgi:hypothetical protein
MKKIYTCIFLLFLFTSSQAQITLGSDDMPSENEEYLVSNSLLLSFDGDATGVDYEWDFSDLNSFSQDTMVYVDISDLSFIYQFVFNNPFDSEFQGTEGLEMSDIDIIPTIDIEDAFLFTKNSSSKLEEIGFGVTFNGLPFPIQYENKKTLYEFPLAYGDSTGDDYAFNVSVPDLAYLGETGTRSYEVDGWGTLISPFGTFDVLRTRIEQIFEDSIYIDSTETGLTIPREQVIYEWLGEGSGVPLLQITTELGIVTSVIYQDSLQIPTSIHDIEREDYAMTIYPQPAEDIVNIKLDKLTNDRIYIKIYDLSGKEVLVNDFPASRLIRLSIGELNPGLYMMEVNSGAFSKVEKLIIR